LWPKLEEKLGKLPKSDALAVPKRSVEDMMTEILKITRAEINYREAISGQISHIEAILERAHRLATLFYTATWAQPSPAASVRHPKKLGVRLGGVEGLASRPRTIGEEEFEKHLTAADAMTLGIAKFSLSVVSIRAEQIVRLLCPSARCEESRKRVNSGSPAATSLSPNRAQNSAPEKGSGPG
jgi:hypothetical protein